MPDDQLYSVALPRRACDACHRRKVKCVVETTDLVRIHGVRSCENCKSSNLACKYESVPQKKGPKGSRAKVITELREHQERQSTLTSSNPSALVPRASIVLQIELIETCIDFFFEHVYPTQPILDRDALRSTVLAMHHNIEAYCLIVSLCAYMLIQPNMQLPQPLATDSNAQEDGALTPLATALLQDLFDARKQTDYVETPSLDSVRTSFFLFGCYFCLEKHNTAYFHLREATTLALLLGMDDERTYRDCEETESHLKRRLFWLLYVTERAYALQTQRPLTLYDTIELPDISAGAGENAEELHGFVHLIVLFKPFDDIFVGLWNQSIKNATTVDWISNLQRQMADALPTYLRSTEAQAVDLKTSQQWLRIMIWQLSVSQRLLSSNAKDEALTFIYPLELSRQLAAEASQFSQQSMEVHGIGLVKKLFDVACTLVDVMCCVPVHHHGFEVFGPRDYLLYFIRLMSRLRGGQTRYLPLLRTKMTEMLPEILVASVPRYLGPSLADRYEETLGAETDIRDDNPGAGLFSHSDTYTETPILKEELQS